MNVCNKKFVTKKIHLSGPFFYLRNYLYNIFTSSKFISGLIHASFIKSNNFSILASKLGISIGNLFGYG